MKSSRRIIAAMAALSAVLLSSCKYDLYEAFGRSHDVNERSRSLEDFNGTSKVPQTDGATKFSVLFITDVHFGRNGAGKSRRYDEDFFAKLSQVQAECESSSYPMKFAICAGDAAETGERENLLLYKQFADRIKTDHNLQVYSVLGNHDLYCSGYKNWEELVYPHCSSYFFKTEDAISNSMSWYFLDTANGSMGNPQLKDFISKAKSDSSPKIVVTHYPIYAGGIFYFTMQNQNERDTLLSTFASQNARGIFEGHAHKDKTHKYKKFYEELTASYLDQQVFGAIFVDLAEGTAEYKRFHY